MTFDFNANEDEFTDFHYSSLKEYETPLKNKAHLRPTVSYLYLNNKPSTEYTFFSTEFGKREIKEYFIKMALFSSQNLATLIDNSNHDLHFKFASETSPEYNVLENHLQIKFNAENKPILGHFALYTDEKIENSKSPRIFFLLGENAIIHILFFDPFHKMHQTKH